MHRSMLQQHETASFVVPNTPFKDQKWCDLHIATTGYAKVLDGSRIMKYIILFEFLVTCCLIMLIQNANVAEKNDSEIDRTLSTLSKH